MSRVYGSRDSNRVLFGMPVKQQGHGVSLLAALQSIVVRRWREKRTKKEKAFTKKRCDASKLSGTAVTS